MVFCVVSCGVHMRELHQLRAQNDKLMLENENLNKQLEVLAGNVGLCKLLTRGLLVYVHMSFCTLDTESMCIMYLQ